MKQKSATVYVVIGLVTIFLIWLLSGKGNSTTINNAAGLPTNVEIPAFNLPPNQPIIIPGEPGLPPVNISYGGITVPGLPASNFYNYNMRSACACGGATVPLYYQEPTTATAPPPPPPTYSQSTQIIVPGGFSGETITGPGAGLGIGTATYIPQY